MAKKRVVQSVEPQLTGSETQNGRPAYKAMRKPPKLSWADPRGLIKSLQNLTRYLEGGGGVPSPLDDMESDDWFELVCRLWYAWRTDPGYELKVPLPPRRTDPGPWAIAVATHGTVWLLGQEPPFEMARGVWGIVGNHFREQTMSMLRDLEAHPKFAEGITDQLVHDAVDVNGLPHNLNDKHPDRQWFGALAFVQSNEAKLLVVQSGATGRLPFQSGVRYPCQIQKSGVALTESARRAETLLLYVNKLIDADAVDRDLRKILRYRLNGGYLLRLPPTGKAIEDFVAAATEDEIATEGEQARKALASQFPSVPLTFAGMAGRR